MTHSNGTRAKRSYGRALIGSLIAEDQLVELRARVEAQDADEVVAHEHGRRLVLEAAIARRREYGYDPAVAVKGESGGNNLVGSDHMRELIALEEAFDRLVAE